MRRAADRVACTCGEGAKIVAMDSGDVVAAILVRKTLRLPLPLPAVLAHQAAYGRMRSRGCPWRDALTL